MRNVRIWNDYCILRDNDSDKHPNMRSMEIEEGVFMTKEEYENSPHEMNIKALHELQDYVSQCNKKLAELNKERERIAREAFEAARSKKQELMSGTDYPEFWGFKDYWKHKEDRK